MQGSVKGVIYRRETIYILMQNTLPFQPNTELLNTIKQHLLLPVAHSSLVGSIKILGKDHIPIFPNRLQSSLSTDT